MASMFYLLYIMKSENLLTPQIINFTGRGAQLFYLFRQVYGNNEKGVEMMKDTFNLVRKGISSIYADIRQGKINDFKMLNSSGLNEDFFVQSKIDMGTGVIRQLARIPGTYNIKGGQHAHNIYNRFDEIGRYSLSGLLSNFEVYRENQKKKVIPIDFTKHSFYYYAEKRAADIERYMTSDMTKGNRNTMYLYFIHDLYQSGNTEDVIVETIWDVSNGSNNPFFKSIEDASKYCKTALKWMWNNETNGVNKLSNNTILNAMENLTKETIAKFSVLNNPNLARIREENKRYIASIKTIVLKKYYIDKMRKIDIARTTKSLYAKCSHISRDKVDEILSLFGAQFIRMMEFLNGEEKTESNIIEKVSDKIFNITNSEDPVLYYNNLDIFVPCAA